MFEVRFNEIDNTLVIFNVSQYPDEINAPVKMEIEPKEYNKVFTDLGLNVLKPINDGEDFIYTYVGTSIAKGKLYNFGSLIGRSFGDVYPYFKEYLYPVFREVLETGDRRDFIVYFYEDNTLQIGIELKVLLNEDEIFFFMENKTEMFELKTRERNNFELSTLPKSIVQNDSIVKINRAHELLTHMSFEEASKLTADEFNKHKIIYNDTGLVLNCSQIIEKLLTNKYHQIIYHCLVDDYKNPKRLECLARLITFQGAPAIEFTVLNELDVLDAELDDFNKGKMDLIQKISKTAFLFYDLEKGSSTWGKSLEYLLEGPIENSDDLKSFFYRSLSRDSLKELNQILSKMKNDDSVIEGEVKLKTFKDNVKYVRYILKPLYQDGKIVKWLQILTDITEDVMKNRELNALKDVVEDVQESTSLAIFYIDDEGKYHWTSEIYNILERKPRHNDMNHHIFLDLLTEEDLDKYYDLVENLAPNEFLGTHIFPLHLENGKTKILEMNARKVYDEFGDFVRRVEYGRDITEQWNYENELIQADAEKTILVKEIHHRVKNNLQVLSSFISLEKKFYGDNPERVIDITRSRIESLALLHETIYNEDHMDYISMNEFFNGFDEKLRPLSKYDDIQFINDIGDFTLYINYVNPLMLIINELTTNSFKYAFKQDSEKIINKSIELIDNGDSGSICRLHYRDNGPGIPEGFDMDSSKSLGWTIIKSLTSQLDGEFKFYNDDGFNFILEFPVMN